MIIWWKTPGGGTTCDYPTPSNTKHDVSYGNGAFVGTYRGADLWSDVGRNNVAINNQYLANGVVQIGTLDVDRNPSVNEIISRIDSVSVLSTVEVTQVTSKVDPVPTLQSLVDIVQLKSNVDPYRTLKSTAFTDKT